MRTPKLTALSGFLLFVFLIYSHEGRSLAQNSEADDLPVFVDITDSAGLAATLTTWHAGWDDFNGDGYPDLLTVSHERLPEFFLNNGNGTFTNIVGSTPLVQDADRHSTAWGDFDNDGDLDLVVSVGGQAGTASHDMELFRNDGGTLVNIAEAAGVTDGLARGRAVSWADYDRDGDLDYFAANHLLDGFPNRLWRNNGDGTFTDVAAAAGVAAMLPLNAANFVDYDSDGWPDIFVLGIAENLLYHNSGDGTFEDVSPSTNFAASVGDAYAWGDYDNDGDADLFIGDSGNAWVDTVQAEEGEVKFFAVTNGDEDGFDFISTSSVITFEVELRGPDNCITVDCIHIGPDALPPAENPFPVGEEAIGAPEYTPGISAGYYIWRDQGTNVWHVRLSDPGLFRGSGIISSPTAVTGVTSVDFEPPPPPGKAMLFRNNGNDTFTDVTQPAGLNVSGNYRSANWVDFDNDGWLDIFGTDKGNLLSGNASNHLFRNNGDGTFSEVTALTGIGGTIEGGANVSAWADINRDGFLDLFTQNGGFGGLWPFDEGPNQMFVNGGNGNHWLEIELVGVNSNKQGLGALVFLTSGDQTRLQANNNGKTAYSQDDTSLHFGLGNNTTVDNITIHWPSGIIQMLAGIAVDQRITIIEAGSTEIFLPVIQR